MKAAMKRLRKDYDRLEDIERFRAVLAADARGDKDELRALYESAPRADYRMTDFPFGGMWDGLLTCAMVVASDVLGWGVLLAWDHALVLGRGPTAEEHESECWDRMKQGARYVLAAWEGLALFAGDLDLDLDHVLRFVPSRGKVDFAVNTAESILSIEEKTVQYVIECAYDDGEAGEVQTERLENLKRRREEAAREYADSLHQIWEKETNA